MATAALSDPGVFRALVGAAVYLTGAGVRDRAHAVGGSFRAGAEPDGRFRLDVRLPLPEAAPPAGTGTPDGSGTALYPTAAHGRRG
jgi:hypothetical protein